MKATILVFSPTGNTRKIASMLQSEMENRDCQVQLLDITGHPCLRDGTFRPFLAERVEKHDVLFIGGPVYAHHMQYHVLELTEALPAPDGHWGRFSVPFISYGGISSGVALKETAAILKKAGRIVPAALKVSAPHSMTRAFLDEEFNKDKLREEHLPDVAELVDRVLSTTKNGPGRSARLGYNGVLTSLKARLMFKEKLWHAERYPRLALDRSRCTGCGLCAARCPVLHLDIHDGKALEIVASPCIHCFSCITACPVGAITLQGDLERGKAFMTRMIVRNGNRETPETAVYPLRRGSPRA